MSVEWVKLKRDRTWGDDDKPSEKAQRVYLVKCSDKNDDPVVAAVACPGPGASYGLAGLIATQRDAKFHDAPGDGGVLYEVTVDYSTKTQDPEQKDPDPLARPAIVKLSFDSFEETVYKAQEPPTAVDTDGGAVNMAGWLWKKAVVNSAGKSFDPSISDCFRDPVLTVTKNVPGLPWSTAQDYVDTINSDAFTITYRGNVLNVAKGQAWLFDINTEPRFENETYYEEATWIFKIRKDGWKRNILDQGLEAFLGDDGTTAHPAPPILDKNGDPIQVPALLDGKGSVVGSPGAGTKPVFLQFRLKREMPFAALGL